MDALSTLANVSSALAPGTSSKAASFPVDVLLAIMCRLPRADLVRAAQVCRSWRDAAYHESLWTFIRFADWPFKVLDAGLALMASRLAHAEYIDLRTCDLVTDKGLHKLAAVLVHKTTLKLDVSECFEVTDRGVVALVECCPKLRVIRTNACGRLTSATIRALAANCPELRELHARFVYAVDEAAWIEFARRCPRLEILELWCAYDLSDSTLIGMAPLLGASLQKICFSSCPGVTDAGIIALAEQCTGLTHIRVADCIHVTDEAVRRLAAAHDRWIMLDFIDNRNVTAAVADVMIVDLTPTINVGFSTREF